MGSPAEREGTDELGVDRPAPHGTYYPTAKHGYWLPRRARARAIARSSCAARPSGAFAKPVCRVISAPVGPQESIAAIGAIQRIRQIRVQSALAGDALRIWLDVKTTEPLERRPAPQPLVTAK